MVGTQKVSTAILPESIPGSELKIGPKNEAFTIDPGTLQSIPLEFNVRGRTSLNQLSYGNMVFDGTLCNDTFLIEVDYRENMKTHANSLPLGGFGADLYFDYGRTALALVLEFCAKNGFKITHKFATQPDF